MNMNFLSNLLKDLIMQDYANIKVLQVCFISSKQNRSRIWEGGGLMDLVHPSSLVTNKGFSETAPGSLLAGNPPNKQRWLAKTKIKYWQTG